MSAPRPSTRSPLNLLVLMWVKTNPFGHQSHRQRWSTQQGLSLLECVVSIAIIGITIAMVAPPLVVATATRVQHRRAEQALEVAQSEVDRIRVMVGRGQHTVNNLPAVPAAFTATSTAQSAPAPSAISTVIDTPRNNFTATPPTTPCASRRIVPDLASPTVSSPYTGTQQIPATNVLPIDVDGDCQADFLMQTFRTPGVTAQTEVTRTGTNVNNRRPSDFTLGVRVYAVHAGQNIQSNRAGTDPAPLTFTRGEGNRRNLPMAVLYTRIAWTEQSGTACGYHANNGRSSGGSSAGICGPVFSTTP